MPIPPELAALIERLHSELNQVEQEATEGLSLAREWLKRFPNQTSLIQLFAYLNNVLLFVATARRRIDYSKIMLQAGTETRSQIQEAGEDLATLLGSTLETQVGVNRVTTRLREWE